MRAKVFEIIAVSAILVCGCQFPRPPDVAPEADAAIRERFLVRIAVTGEGAGEIVVSPGGLRCVGGVCEFSFDRGSQVSIDAALATDLDVVESVTGNCGSLPCSITVDADIEVGVAIRRMSCQPNVRTCEAGLYTECDSAGEFVSYDIPNGGGEGVPATLVMDRYHCPMRCDGVLPRCTDVDVFGLNAVMDSLEVSAAGADLVLPLPGSPDGVMSIDTTSQFDGTYVVMSDTSGDAVRLPAKIVRSGSADNEVVLVVRARTFTLRSGSVLQVRGQWPLVVMSHFDVVIGGVFDLSAEQGAFRGGGSGSYNDSDALCAGGVVSFASGGGSSRCLGGNASTGATRGDQKPASQWWLGGCIGGWVLSGLTETGMGGGALGLISRTKVRLGTNSVLDVSGGGGRATIGRASGGGAGGDVLVYSPVLQMQAGAVVAARGGSGAAAGPTAFSHGREGPVDGSLGAMGATCSGCGVGGTGGSEADATYAGGLCGGDASGSGDAIAGGGGAAGQFVVYTYVEPSIPVGAVRAHYERQVVLERTPH